MPLLRLVAQAREECRHVLDSCRTVGHFDVSAGFSGMKIDSLGRLGT